MKKPQLRKILIADRIHPTGILLLKKNGFAVFCCYNFSNTYLIKKASDLNTEILIVRSVRNLDRQFISKLKNETPVRVVCTASSGLDNIDVVFARKAGIVVLNVPKGNYVSAAEHTFALILAALKNLTKHDSVMKKNTFDSNRFHNTELSGKTIGIIGVGRVGSYVARIAKAFNMKILGNDIKNTLRNNYKWIRFVGFKNLLQSSDIVTVHVPLNETTTNLIDKMEFKMLRKNAVFINCSRGEVVNEEALIKALKRNKLSYAGLDVFKNEPKINNALTELHNVILTPHVAGKTVESIERISLLLSNSIIAFYGRNSH